MIVNIHDLKLLGRHNHENVMAAVAISDEHGRSAGEDPEGDQGIQGS